MPINIQDNFKINIALPIDSRIVASGSVARNNIPFKYDGLRVFDTSDRKSYVYNSSTGLFTSADTAGSGTSNTLARWATSESLTASNVYFLPAGGFLGINTSNPKGALEVRGNSGAAKFVFHSYNDGVVLGQNFYNESGDQYFDFGQGSSAIRMNTSGRIDFLARVFNTIPLNSTGDTNLMMRIDPQSPQRTFLYTDLVLSSNRPLPSGSNSALYLRAYNGFSTAAQPDITWWYNDQTGIYHPANNILGFSINGQQMARLTSVGLIIGGTITTTSHKIQIYEPSASNTFLQVTNSATSTGSTRGSFFGTDTSGNLSIWARGNSAGGVNARVITLGVGSSQITHKFDESSYSIYGGPILGGAVSPSDAISTNRSRCIRGYASRTSVNNALTTAFIGSLYFPDSTSFFSLEVIFTTRIGTTHYKVQKQLFLGYHDGTNTTLFKDNISGLTNLSTTDGGLAPTGAQVTLNSFYFGQQIYKAGSSSSDTNIGNGLIFFQPSTTPKSIEFNVYVKAGSGVTVYSSASWTMNVIDF
jgi:hypothetical protein